jgi:hypothetical protein
LPLRAAVEVEPDRPAFVTATLQPREAGRRSPLWWILGAGGAASLVGGAVVGWLAKSTHEEFQQRVDEGRGNVLDLRRRGESLNLAADVLLIGGGALALVGGTLFLATATSVHGVSTVEGAVVEP